MVLKESWRGWPHAASSPPHADGQDACVAPDTSPRERCQCSPCTTTYLHKTLPEHVSLNPVAPVSSPRKTTSAVSMAASAAVREGVPRAGVPLTIAMRACSLEGRARPMCAPTGAESSTDPFRTGAPRPRPGSRRMMNLIDVTGYLVCRVYKCDISKCE